MITVNFFTTLRIFLNLKQVKIATPRLSIADLLTQCETQISRPFIHKLLENEKIIPGTMILVNGQNILHLRGVETIVNDGDEVALFPPGGGG